MQQVSEGFRYKQKPASRRGVTGIENAVGRGGDSTIAGMARIETYLRLGAAMRLAKDVYSSKDLKTSCTPSWNQL